eukprot:PhM_4_TR12144/c0_g1_i1/m.57345/K20347/TMED2, EMP24; p24 family protein beta-1
MRISLCVIGPLCVVLLLASTPTTVEAFHGQKFTHSLTFPLVGHEERCFYVDTKASEERVYFYFATREGSWDFDVTVRDTKGDIVYRSEAEHDGEKHIYFLAKESAGGTYSFCFDNTMHSKSQKMIAVAIASTTSSAQKRHSKDPTYVTLSRLEAITEELSRDVQYMQTRERVHRNTAESTNARVLGWAVFEGVVLFGMSYGQVMYLQRLFTRPPTRNA